MRCLRASPLNQTMTGMYVYTNGVVCEHVCVLCVLCVPICLCTQIHVIMKVYNCLSTLSFSEAIRFGREGAFDGFLAVGGGSVMDSAKVANLFACYPESDLMDFVAVPHGKGKPILKQLKPLICGEPRCVRMYVCVCACVCCMHVNVRSCSSRRRGAYMVIEETSPCMCVLRVLSVYFGCSSHNGWHW